LSGPLHTIVDALAAKSSSEALAYEFLTDGTSESEIRWTFADTFENAQALAAHLGESGIGAHDRVVLAVNPGLEYVAALYGIMQLGAIPVPCFPPLRPKELDRFHAITLDCSPKGIVIDGMYRDQMAALRNRLKASNVDPVVVYADDRSVRTATVEPATYAPNDFALIQYTSGSTGSPKGVCITHDNLVSNCEALGRSMGDDPDRVGLSWLPPYHDMGLMGTIMLSIYHGWPLVLMPPLHFVQEPRRWLKAISDYRISITVGPNFSLDLCADALSNQEIQDLDLSTVKQLYCGAEPISADTLARFQRAAAPLGFDEKAMIPCYGMAEATLFVAGKQRGSRYRTDRTSDRYDTGRTVVSCGVVDSEHTVRIVDTATRRCVGDGVVGEIWVSGRSVAAGYYNRPEFTHKIFHARLAGEDGEYLRTGDLGFMRAGELYVTGRIKDLIIVCGRNIYPHDVEATALAADPAFRTAVAFSINHDSTEQLCVVAEVAYQSVSADLHSRLVEAIRRSVTSELGIRPHVILCPKRTIPTTTSGKVRRQEARRMLLSNGLPPIQVDKSAISGCTA